MSDCEVMVKPIGQKLYAYLERNPNEYDVTFSVGPEKEEVKALKIILKASSSVFEQEFNEKWEKAVLREGTGIPLPDLDPKAFRVFIQLLISDTWSAEALESMKLSPNELFHLLAICKKFQIPEALKQLKGMTDDFLNDFDSFLHTEDVLHLDRATLETCLKSDLLTGKETDIFEAVCYWAKFRCESKQLELTTTNLREELGSILFEVRFPLMSLMDLTRIRLKNILTAEERLALFDFITLNTDALNMDPANFPFNTCPRGLGEVLTLDLAEELAVVEDPPFVCDGEEMFTHELNPNSKMALIGLGFLGPIDADAFYGVAVQICRLKNGILERSTKLLMKSVFAKKGKTLYFLFDEPVTLDPLGDDRWNKRHRICYYLHGPNTKAIELPSNNQVSLSSGKLECKLWYNSRQLIQILFKTLE